MTRDKVLIALTAVGSAWSWWPLIREPILEFSPWIPVGVVALICALSTALANGRWLRSVIASTGGSFLGMWAGLLIFPSDDGIRNAYALIPIMVGTAAVFIASLFTSPDWKSDFLVTMEQPRRLLGHATHLCCLWSADDGGDTTVGRSPDGAQRPARYGKVGRYEDSC